MVVIPRPGRRPRCDLCHEAVGVYEPVVWQLSDSVTVTTQLVDPEIASPQRRGFVYHRCCYEARPGLL